MKVIMEMIRTFYSRDWGKVCLVWVTQKALFSLVLVFTGQINRTIWDTLFLWDGMWYRLLADRGYWFEDVTVQSTIAFPPLYSFFAHSLTFLGLSINVALVGISWISSLGAFVVLFNLLKRHFPVNFSFRVILVMMFAPWGFVWSLPYSESLFLLVLVSMWNLLDRKKILWAGILFALLPLVRLTGIVFGLLFLLGFLTDVGNRWRYLAGGVLGISGLVMWLCYIHITFGGWDLPFGNQLAWNRGFYFFPSLLVFQFAQYIQYYLWYGNSLADMINLVLQFLPYSIDWISLLFLSSLVLLNWKKLPNRWGLVTLLYLVYVLSFPSYSWEHVQFIPILGASRYLMVCFPIAVLVVMHFTKRFELLLQFLIVLNLVFTTYFTFGYYIP